MIDAEDPVGVAEALSKIPGVDYTAVVKVTPSNYEDVIKAITRAGMRLIYPDETFTVEVDLKGALPYSSRDIEFSTCARLIGELGEKGVRQDKKNPSKVIYAKIEDEIACIFYYKYDGPGGRPIGSKGKALCLLSDDNGAVATWMIARQGIFPYILFFDTRPYVSHSYVKRVITIATLFREFLPVRNYNLITLRIGFIIDRLKQSCSPEVLPFIFKRMAIRIACAYADKVGVSTIVSGEGIGQSTLQTFMDSFKISSTYNKQVLFPLIGLIDREIVDYLRGIGVLKFTKESEGGLKGSPTKPDKRAITEAEGKLEIDQLIEEALNNVTLIDLKSGFNDVHGILDDYFSSKA
ncbi:MAG: hypothetical protein H3Z50_05190 [archaeon]|nr:hypothetical protein [archaeon]